MLVDAKGSLEKMSFDLPKQIQTCALITDFKSPLPNRGELERELARFAVLKNRGFIGTVDESLPLAQVNNPARQALDARGDRISSAPHSSGGIGGGGGYVDRNHTGPPGNSRDDDDGGPRVRPGDGGQVGNGPPSHGPGGNGPKGR